MNRSYARSFALVAACLVLAGCGNAPVSYSGTFETHGRDQADRSARQTASANGEAVVLERAEDGHFYADAEINGTTIRFMVDTGATSVALTEQDAATLGIELADEDFTERGSGVGGIVGLKPVTLDSLAVGDIEITGVDAVVAKSSMNVSLLGQSWLSRLDKMTVQGDQMVLR